MFHLPVLYINLEKDQERRQRMEKQLFQLQIPAQRMPAVWWKEVPPTEQARHHKSGLTQRQYFKPMGNGEKGCYCSHLQAWQRLLDSDAPAMVIFEDDVRLLPQLPQILDKVADLPPNKWDLIKLYGREKEKIASRLPLEVGDFALITYRRVPSFAAGYVISRAGAEKMLRTRIPFGRPVDVDMRFWFENDIRIFGVYPSVIALDDTSQISSIWAQKELPMTLGQRLRKLKMKIELTWGNTRAKHPHVDDLKSTR